ncbi:MAG: phosphate ABC transporter substrate-binding/OmpA family protein, partial [Patescibacteria group bacterium]
VIVMVIDESKGGDAIVARKSAGESLNAFRGQHPRVAFTPFSPSHHLLKAAKSHFSLPELLPAKGTKERVETNGSTEALEKLKAGAVDVAVLWEPDVSRALAIPSVVKLLGTEQTAGYIVDVLMVNRVFLKEHKSEVKLFLSTYFRTLKNYLDSPEEMKKDLMAETKLSAQEVDQMIKGVNWVNLTTNCRKWFGISAPNEERTAPMIVEAIESTVAILIDNGDFDKNPLPDGDPYKIFYTETLEELYVRGEVGFAKAQESPVTNSLESKFEQLAPEKWDRLAEVGTFKVEPIVFQSGTSRLTYEGKETLDSMADSLKHFPNFRVRVSGHTSVEGDPDANKQLSLARAESVVQYLIVTYNIDANRFQALGLGGEKPLPQLSDETERGWYYRLPRVELLLLKEEL